MARKADGMLTLAPHVSVFTKISQRRLFLDA
jgi:hypothetical protein